MFAYRDPLSIALLPFTFPSLSQSKGDSIIALDIKEYQAAWMGERIPEGLQVLLKPRDNWKILRVAYILQNDHHNKSVNICCHLQFYSYSRRDESSPRNVKIYTMVLLIVATVLYMITQDLFYT